MVIATSWLATTVSGHFLPSRTSILRSSDLLATTIASATSSGAVAIILAFMVSPTRCPARPARCTILDTCLGELNWMTRSVLPTSMPSSRDDVHTRALRSPFLKRSSMSILFSFEREPWCTSIEKSGSQRRYRAASHSAVSLVFTKNKVERPVSISLRACIITPIISGSV